MKTFFHRSQFSILTNPKLKENFIEEKEKWIKVRNSNGHNFSHGGPIQAHDISSRS